MRLATATGNTIAELDARLDAAYYTSGATQAVATIHAWAKREAKRTRNATPAGLTRPLASVTRGKPFIPGRFKRIYVTDPEHGEPYITGSSIVQADPLADTPYLSRRYTVNQDELRLQKQMIVITCSGAIGNSVYVHGELAGTLGSPDLLRVVADERQILPGYLFAYLSGPLGRTLIKQSTYGAVIPHIEAHHVFDLPVPMLPRPTQRRIHELIERAAQLRVQATAAIRSAVSRLDRELGTHRFQYQSDHSYCVDKVEFSGSRDRLDAFYYVGYCQEAQALLKRYRGQVIEASTAGYAIDNPPLFTRVFADEGHPYMSGIELYQLKPATPRFLSRKMADVGKYLISEGMVLVQSAGQRYGLIGTPLFVTTSMVGIAATSDIVRVQHSSRIENGYICGLFLSGVGRRLVLRYSYGSSIPRLNVPAMADMEIPWPESTVRHRVGRSIISAYEKRDEANRVEAQAHAVLAQAIGA